MRRVVKCWQSCARTSLRHNHQYCGDFCQRKVTKLALVLKMREGKCITLWKKIPLFTYKVLRGIIEDFTTIKLLEEVGHGFDTNHVNESLNQSKCWFALKNKTYCGSHSLRYRIAMAICIHDILGYDALPYTGYDHTGTYDVQMRMDGDVQTSAVPHAR